MTNTRKYHPARHPVPDATLHAVSYWQPNSTDPQFAVQILHMTDPTAG